MREIICHKPALKIHKVDIIAAPGQIQNIQLGNQRVNTMAQAPNRQSRDALEGADPALIQILQIMEDIVIKEKFKMFLKQMFNGTTKGLAKSHWLESKKYLDYQHQQGFLNPNDLNTFEEVKQMFQMTLNDNTLGWYDADNANWVNLEQMKQVFLKHFNIWGDTRRQQPDSWNKLRFNMAKDDVDTFVTDMKTLASILGHNNEVLAKKFKDVFPDKDIEAVLLAMDNLDEMQAKAKQLVQIYKPQHDADSSMGACLMHKHDSPPKNKTSKKTKQKESNQHQLAPISQAQSQPQNPQSQQGQQNPRYNDRLQYQGGKQNENNDGYYCCNEFHGNRGRGHGRGRGGRGQWNNNSNKSDRGAPQDYPSNQGRG